MAKYRVTLSKNWKGSAKRAFKGAVFNKACDEQDALQSRIKVMTLSESEAKDAAGAGFLVVELKPEEIPKPDGEPLTPGGKRRRKRKQKEN